MDEVLTREGRDRDEFLQGLEGTESLTPKSYVLPVHLSDLS